MRLTLAVALAGLALAASSEAQPDNDVDRRPTSTPVTLKGTLPSIPPVPRPARGGDSIRPQRDPGMVSVAPTETLDAVEPAPAPPGPAPRDTGVRGRIVDLDPGAEAGKSGPAAWLGALALAALVIAVAVSTAKRYLE